MPRFATNWELSAARALSVVHYLQDTAKLDPTRLARARLQPVPAGVALQQGREPPARDRPRPETSCRAAQVGNVDFDVNLNINATLDLDVVGLRCEISDDRCRQPDLSGGRSMTSSTFAFRFKFRSTSRYDGPSLPRGGGLGLDERHQIRVTGLEQDPGAGRAVLAIAGEHQDRDVLELVGGAQIAPRPR